MISSACMPVLAGPWLAVAFMHMRPADQLNWDMQPVQCFKSIQVVVRQANMMLCKQQWLCLKKLTLDSTCTFQARLASGMQHDAAHAKLWQYGGMCRLRICGTLHVSVVQTHVPCGRTVTPASFGLDDLFADGDEVSQSNTYHADERSWLTCCKNEHP